MRLLPVCLSVSVLHAYTLWTTSNGAPLHRTDAASIQYLVNKSTAAGMINADGNVVITADSDPMKALQAAATAWSSIPTAAVNFLPLQTTSAVNDQSDKQHVIVFVDTPDNRSLVGSALAVTAATFFSDGSVVDADIVFNPTVTFSTNLAPNTYDLQSVATHEMGHSLGANHSGVLSATMFYGLQAQINSPSVLSADDVAFVTSAYPGPGSADSFGVISGTVSLASGLPVLGALLVAADPVSGITVGGFSSLNDGTYSFKVPRGSYLLYAEPLNGEVSPQNLYLPSAQLGQVNTSFQTTFSDGLASPQLVDVTAGQANVNITVADGVAPFSILASGTGSVLGSGDFEISAGPTLLTARKSVDLLLYGPGLDSVGAQYEVRLLGPGVTLRQNSVHLDTNTSVNGSRLLRMTVDVAPRSSPGVASVVVVQNSVAAALSGGLLILPAQ
jgi:predicted Zn-dependent protease